MASGHDWTEETIARLRALWDEGLNTAEIGLRMGLSKNAIIGKAHRLHLAPRPSPILPKGSGSRPGQHRRIRKDGPSLPPLRSVADDTAPPRPPAPAPAESAAPVFVRRVSRDPCCWPTGEPGTRSYRTCDAPAKPGKPYCVEHAEAAYVPASYGRHTTAERSAMSHPLRKVSRRLRPRAMVFGPAGL